MCALDKNALIRLAADFVDRDASNFVAAEIAVRPDLAGMRMYDAPLIGFASAADPLFDALRKPGVIGPHFDPPGVWLPGAKTVISFFAPHTEAVIASNRLDRERPSAEWLYARMEGQAMLNLLGAHLAAELEKAGHRAVYPAMDARFYSWSRPAGRNDKGVPLPAYTSNWSERHVAHVCGLGTFGMSAALITRRGVCGRIGSVVTTMPAEPDARPYSRFDEYCSHCGSCVRNCFIHALFPDKVKDKHACSRVIEERKIQYKPRYGCGKCYVNVPCERGIPAAAGAAF